MSFVSIIARKNFVTVVSDGLVVDLITGEEKEQEFKKFEKISRKQFVAFSGNKGLGEKVVDFLGFESEERDIFLLAKVIREKLIKDIDPKDAFCQVVLGGIEKNSVVLYAFNNHENQKMQPQKPTGDQIGYFFLTSSNHKLNLDDEISKILETNDLKTPAKSLKCQKELNNIVAKVDSSVNTMTFNLIIKK